MTDTVFAPTPAGLFQTIAPRHALTTRALSFRGDTLGADWETLSRALETPQERIVRVSQVHGRRVLVVTPEVVTAVLPPNVVEADAIVCTDPSVAVVVRVADCVPILVADRQHRVVATIHAGWRGSCAGIARAAIEAITDLGIPAADLVAVIGPSMGPCCYQVDDRVRNAFLGMTPDAASWFTDDGFAHWKLDLWQANKDQLIDAGVPEDAIEVLGICTGDERERCWSYRRDGANAGRMVAGIKI